MLSVLHHPRKIATRNFIPVFSATGVVNPGRKVFTAQRNRQQRRHKHLTGEQLAYCRKVAGMTQHDVARETGISFHRLAYAETDRLELRPKEIDALTGLHKRHIGQALAAIQFLRSAQ